MRDRRALVLGLCMFAALGCASREGSTIHFAADRSPRGLKWPLIGRSASRTGDSPQPSATDGQTSRQVRVSGPSEVRMERFLSKLDPETRELAEQELAAVQPEEARNRLLAYLATVEPDRVRGLLESRRQAQMTERRSPAPTDARTRATESVIEPVASAPELTAAEVSDGAWQAAPDEAEPPTAPRVRTVSARDYPDDEPARPVVTLTTVEPDLTESVNPLRSAPVETSQPPIEEANPPTVSGADSGAGVSALAKLRQFDPRKTLSFGREALAPTPETTEPARGTLSRIASRVMHPEPAAAPPTPPPAPPPTTVRSDLNATYLQEELQRLISLMEAEAGRLQPGSTFDERDEYLRRQAELRMLYLMAGHPQQAQQSIAGVDADSQEFWSRTMWGLSSYFESESISDPSERATRALEQLQIALQHLRASARLEVVNLAFCDRIDGFGVYHTYDQDIFRAGQLVLLYAEVRNFKSLAGADNLHRTRLRSTIEILEGSADGPRVETWALEATEDLSRSPRNDHFHSYKLDLPADLAPGSYTVRLTLEDELSNKVASTTIDFLIR